MYIRVAIDVVLAYMDLYKMKKGLFLLLIQVLLCGLCACVSRNANDDLRDDLQRFVDGKDADIGIAVIVDGKDTIFINGERLFPMLSVYKFPIVLALGDYGRTGAKLLADSIWIFRGDLNADTHSPLFEKYGYLDSTMVSMDELLSYALRESDNNASDILLGLLPDVGYVNHYLGKMGVSGINVMSTEAQMHENPDLCFSNTSTPLAMACLFDRFDAECNDYFSKKIKNMMEGCETGENRLCKPLRDGAIIGHKTGTGFTLPDGRLMAVNDAGYVHLPNGRRYSIAVFISNSGYDVEESESLISEISRIVWSRLK